MYLLLLILWLVLNGRITPELLLLGLGVVLLLGAALWGLFGYTPRRELKILRCVPLALAYLAVLLWQIVKANFTVIRLIFSPAKRLDPVLIRVRVDLKTSLARYILANSITLTPGTITVRSEDGVLTVHCLSASLMEDVENGVFVRLLRRMEA
jgi:multicomponent Na+:H+ antiporter subunit E